MSKKASSKAHSSKANAQRARLSRAYRATIAQRNRSSLSLFRQLTHSRNLRDFHESRILKNAKLPTGVFEPFSFLNRAISPQEHAVRVCRSRKERRQVLFAKGKAGGHHRPPRWNLDSYTVRC